MVQASSITPRCWSIDGFERFWSNPNRDSGIVAAVLTQDVVGHWSGRDEPVRGRTEYTRCISTLMDALPDMHLTVAEYAVSEEFVFIRWIMHAIGRHGPFELTGIDRVRLRNGQVSENVVVFDTAAFQARSGKAIPWA
jgi:hypothetical protein